MLFKHAAQGDEKAFLTIKNVEASSLTTGYLVCIRTGTASFDGTQAVRAISTGGGDLYGFIGVAAIDIVSNGFGPVQCFGAAASVFFSNVGSSITFTTGDALIPGAVAGGAFSVLPTILNSGGKFIICSAVGLNTISAAGWVSGYVRCI
jgi:hypothetical protein